MLVQALVPETTVEAFDERVLHGAARFDERERDAVLFGPLIHHFASELRAVVAHDAGRVAARPRHAIQSGDDTFGGQRALDLNQETLPRRVVHEGEIAEAPTVGQRIADEIHAPPLVRAGDRRLGDALERDALPWSLADVQSGFAMHALHTLAIDAQALAAQQTVQASVAPPRPQDRQRPQTLAQRHIVLARLVALRRPREARVAARLGFRETGGLHRVLDDRPPL